MFYSLWIKQLWKWANVCQKKKIRGSRSRRVESCAGRMKLNDKKLKMVESSPKQRWKNEKTLKVQKKELEKKERSKKCLKSWPQIANVVKTLQPQAIMKKNQRKKANKESKKGWRTIKS